MIKQTNLSITELVKPIIIPLRYNPNRDSGEHNAILFSDSSWYCICGYHLSLSQGLTPVCWGLFPSIKSLSSGTMSWNSGSVVVFFISTM